MFGIRKALKRAFSIETIATAVERKIASDMAANPTHPRNAIGEQLMSLARNEAEKSAARREMREIGRDWQQRTDALKARVNSLNQQPQEWLAANYSRLQAEIDQEQADLNEMFERFKELSKIAGVD